MIMNKKFKLISLNEDFPFSLYFVSFPALFSYEDLFVLQLVSAVTELVIAELMYLQWLDDKEPIYIYINSTGTTRDDGETVSLSIVKLFIFLLYLTFLLL